MQTSSELSDEPPLKRAVKCKTIKPKVEPKARGKAKAKAKAAALPPIPDFGEDGETEVCIAIKVRPLPSQFIPENSIEFV